MPYQVAWYQYPDKTQHDLWYLCLKRQCTVYLHFPDHWEGEHEVGLALKIAIEKNTCALRVTRKCPESALSDYPQYRSLRDRLVFTECEYKPYIPHFNSDFCAVDYEDLVDIEELSHNVRLVSFRGERFAYKFITPERYQNSFETEVETYKKLVGVPGIPHLTAVVRKEGLNRGLL